MFRINNIDQVLRDESISKTDKNQVLKCYKYVKNSYDALGTEPFNGNTCITVDGGYHCVKVHADRTISYVRKMEAPEKYYKFSVL